MAKLTYLQMLNRILGRITHTTLDDVADATGTDLVAKDYINEAQIYLFSETDWYSLYKTRKFKTVQVTGSSDITFNDDNPDTITSGASAFGDFQNGQLIHVSGTTNNNGTWTVNTAAAGTLTLQTADELTAEASTSAVITAISYPVASDWGRTIDLIDVTNDNMIFETTSRLIDERDPNSDETGNPEVFSVTGDQLRLGPVPSGVVTIRERYFAVPGTLSASANTSDLPIELENCIIYYALYKTLEYQNKFDHADRMRLEFERQLKRAMVANKRKINRLLRIGGNVKRYGAPLAQAQLPSAYDWRYR